MFSRIFIEKDVRDHKQTQHILNKFSKVQVQEIDRVDDVFGVVKKPYLQKRESLQLFVGKKRGTLIKEAPDAYGLAGEPHYYFIHAYNCIYECEYCYLQGYFNSPDIVLFINHEDITEQIEKMCHNNTNTNLWFHAGEFSDSLALNHLTGELEHYFNTFKDLKNAYLELRTKSANIKNLLKLEPLNNVITSFSLSPQNRVKSTDLGTAPLKARLSSLAALNKAGHPIAIHLDPVIHEDEFESQYNELIASLVEYVKPCDIRYLSIGVVRFSSSVYHQVKKNYPNSQLHAAEFISSFDNKVRYPRPFRMWILSKIKEICLSHGLKEKQIYLCME